MYVGVPMTTPVRVARSSSVAASPTSLEMPKSSTFGSRSVPSLARQTKTFSGLRSRWTTPDAWAAATPRITGIISPMVSSGSSRPRIKMSESGSPCSSSITRKTALSWVPTSKMVTTFGWSTRPAARASRRKRSTSA